jgi:hypothetical protein
MMRVDVHAHLWSERYLDLLVRLGSSRTAVHRGLGAGATDDELRKRFDLMDGERGSPKTTFARSWTATQRSCSGLRPQRLPALDRVLSGA